MTDDVAISTKGRPGTYDAIETARPDEPLFTLQGGDPLAPATIARWVRLARLAARRDPDRAKAERLLRKASAAEQVAWAFQSYQRGGADVARADVEPVVEAQTEPEPADDRAARIRLAERLHNLAGMAAELATALGDLDNGDDWSVQVRVAGLRIGDAARDVEPRRGEERS